MKQEANTQSGVSDSGRKTWWKHQIATSFVPTSRWVWLFFPVLSKASFFETPCWSICNKVETTPAKYRTVQNETGQRTGDGDEALRVRKQNSHASRRYKSHFKTCKERNRCCSTFLMGIFTEETLHSNWQNTRIYTVSARWAQQYLQSESQRCLTGLCWLLWELLQIFCLYQLFFWREKNWREIDRKDRRTFRCEQPHHSGAHLLSASETVLVKNVALPVDVNCEPPVQMPMR